LSRRRLTAWIFGLLGVVVLIGAGAVVLLISVDLKHLLEEHWSLSPDRRLTIGSLRIGWGNPLSLELRDIRLANAPWGSSPEMAQVESISAEIDFWSLFAGATRFQKLEMVNPVIVLERDADGTGNWRVGKIAPPSSSPANPKSRSQFPTLIDLALRGGKVSLRTSSGNWLRVELHDLKISSAGADQPVTIALDGAYNDLPAKLTGEAQSFNILREASLPYGIVLSIADASSAIAFKGTLMDPANFDGVQGAVKIDAQNLGDLLRIFGAESGYNPPLQVSGDLNRNGDHWQISHANGMLLKNAFIGGLILDEAGRGQADDVSADLSFAELDLTPPRAAATKPGGAKTGDWGALSLRSETQRGTNIAAHVAAKLLTYGTLRLADVEFRGGLASGAMSLEQLKFAVASGTLDVSGRAENAVVGSHLVARAVLSGIDAGQLSRLAGAETGQLAGRLDGGVTLDMSGDTIQAALKASRGHAVLAVTQAHVARDLIEKVSTDVRSLFRTREGVVEVTCLLGVVDLRDGIGTVRPLRMRTSDGTLVGGGQVDFLRQRLNLIIQSESASTSFFALDVPVRVSGDFQRLSIQSQIGPSGVSFSPAGNDPLNDLPQDLRSLAERNSCVR
jgi:uncharacterized protein involved in outer membrane biogenesis